MTEAAKRTVSLAPEQADYIDNLVASGSYASTSEVVQAGLQALQDRNEAIEQWLREEVVPVHEAMKADPSLAIPAEEVFGRIRARYAEMARTK